MFFYQFTALLACLRNERPLSWEDYAWGELHCFVICWHSYWSYCHYTASCKWTFWKPCTSLVDTYSQKMRQPHIRNVREGGNAIYARGLYKESNINTWQLIHSKSVQYVSLLVCACSTFLACIAPQPYWSATDSLAHLRNATVKTAPVI